MSDLLSVLTNPWFLGAVTVLFMVAMLLQTYFLGRLRFENPKMMMQATKS
jgi:hypothetical protein